MTSAAASGRSSLRSVKCRSPARAWASSTSGVSVAGGSASTWASSRGWAAGWRASRRCPAPRLRPAGGPRTGPPPRPPAPAAPAGQRRARRARLPRCGPSTSGSIVRVRPRRRLGAGDEQPVQRAALLSSSWVPMSATRPRSRTAIRSARSSVERRCAMSSVVRPRITSRSAAWISASTRASTAEVASSRSSSRGSVSSARASATRCRWPPERVRPCSPTTVS